MTSEKPLNDDEINQQLYESSSPTRDSEPIPNEWIYEPDHTYCCTLEGNYTLFFLCDKNYE